MSYLEQAQQYLRKGEMPEFLVRGLQYEVLMGSHAYGVAQEGSDLDFYGWSVPSENQVYAPGYLVGFDDKPHVFNQWQRQLNTPNGTEWDFAVYGVTRYFKLVADNNPNMVESLFNPDDCVTHLTELGKLVRDNRTSFLSKRFVFKTLGYAQSEKKKVARSANFETSNSRTRLVHLYGYDVKSAYHAVRLMGEARQVLETGNLDLGSQATLLKALRSGEWEYTYFQEYFQEQLEWLDANVHTSTAVQEKVDTGKVRNLLVRVLEAYYAQGLL